GADARGALLRARFFGGWGGGKAEPLREVMEHNHQDVVSMARLLAVLAERMANPEGQLQAHPGDLVGLARAYRRNGRPIDALTCLDAALAQPDPDRTEWGFGSWFDRGQAWLD